ncbi:hypothetical protein [Dongia sp.]|uniref:hypothetical protein n=1 Tax=Dongia sp. TaxID=1977262 RepID=UPI0037531A72
MAGYPDTQWLIDGTRRAGSGGRSLPVMDPATARPIHGTEGGSEALESYFDTRLVTRKG